MDRISDLVSDWIIDLLNIGFKPDINFIPCLAGYPANLIFGLYLVSQLYIIYFFEGRECEDSEWRGGGIVLFSFNQYSG